MKSIRLQDLSEAEIIKAIQEMLGPKAIRAGKQRYDRSTSRESAGPNGMGGAPNATGSGDRAAENGVGKDRLRAPADPVPPLEDTPYAFSVGEAWESLSDIDKVAEEYPSLWTASEPYVGQIRAVRKYETALKREVLARAGSNLLFSEKWVKAELKKVGGSERASTEPSRRSAAQKSYMEEVREAADGVSVAEEAKTALLAIEVFDPEGMKAGGGTSQTGPMLTTPFRPEEPHEDYVQPGTDKIDAAPKPLMLAQSGDVAPGASEPSRQPGQPKSAADFGPLLTEFENESPMDEGASAKKVMNWSEVRQMWATLSNEIAECKENYPSVQALAAAGSLGKFLEQDDGKAFDSLTRSLNGTLDAIAKTRSKLQSSIEWYDLDIAIDQVLSSRGGSGVDWSKPVAKFAALRAREQVGETKWWEVLGIAAGLATLIISGPVGLALSAVELATGVAGAVGAARDLLSKGNLGVAAKAAAKPSLALLSSEASSKRQASALWGFALSVLAILGAIRVAKGYRQALARRIRRAIKFGPGTPEWESVAKQLGITSERLKEYVYMYEELWAQIEIHHAVMQEFENSTIISLGMEKGVFHLHQLDNLIPLPKTTEAQMEIIQAFGESRAVHYGSHPRVAANVGKILRKNWQILEQKAGTQSVRQFVQTTSGRQVLQDLCEKSRVAARKEVDNVPGYLK
ncbi:MAG: hypothetical protein R3B89_35320 [Polyangiaceae bacterium]